ncbi:MAG: cyclic 2,3-diphosphoglycerate synthase [Halodesulfurarchaeum sp.]
MPRRILIMGAAGRDFHDFNTIFRDDETVEVVGFTQTHAQNMGELDDLPERRYPPSLAGENYPDGIPIVPESDLEDRIEEHDVDNVVFSYSDVSHETVMHQASRALAAGAGFRIVGSEMMLESSLPVVAVDAVRTGCGKSQASRKLTELLHERGTSVAVVREPMPYGDLERQRVQRFETTADLESQHVTIEEREEYEHHLERGHVVFAGVDYEAVLAEAEKAADVILWDGGNNELPFFEPDLHVVLADPHRPGHEIRYHPGETNLRLADAVLINKENTADPDAIRQVTNTVESVNPDASIIHADSVVSVEDPSAVEGKRVLAVEDGPTLTHGGADEGAAAIAARQFGADELVDPRPSAVGSVTRIFEEYPHLGNVLPAMGYSEQQIADLERSIEETDCDVVLAGTPIDLGQVIDVDVPIVRVHYEIQERGEPTLDSILDQYSDVLGL